MKGKDLLKILNSMSSKDLEKEVRVSVERTKIQEYESEIATNIEVDEEIEIQCFR